MSDYADFTRNRIYTLDALTFLKTLPSESINCCVTSPPYWGLRAYLATDDPNKKYEMGMEPTLKGFIDNMTVLFREVRRVLRSDGVCFVNMGDSYASSVNGRSADDTKAAGNDDRTFRDKPFSTVGNGLKPKDLCGQPWRLAFALQDDGFYLRSDIIWHKPNPMPESVSDRPTKSHEYVFLLTKSERYFYDADAIREPVQESTFERANRGNSDHHKNIEGHMPGNKLHSMHKARANGEGYPMPANRNKRSVWTIPTEPTPFAHFATFPQALIEPMILAGCPDKTCSVCGAPYVREVEATGGTIGKSWNDHKHDMTIGTSSKGYVKAMEDGSYQRTTLGFKPTCTHNAPTRPGIVLDIFMGSGTVALVSRRLGRDFLGSELNPEYVALANSRLAHNSKAELKAALAGELATMPMF
jgi:DNA modification methylase